MNNSSVFSLSQIHFNPAERSLPSYRENKQVSKPQLTGPAPWLSSQTTSTAQILQPLERETCIYEIIPHG